MALINEVPLGHRRIDIGLKLRQAWLLNGILYNSEVWQKLTEKDKNDLNKMDHILLREILGAQAKVPIEQLYLETATLPVDKIISMRRMIYLQTILQREEGELIRKIFLEMRSDPEKDDWCELVKSDFENINLKMSDLQIQDMNPTQYKSLIKKTIREATFLELKILQESHQKGSLMHHEDLNSPQNYLVTNKLTNKEISLLFNLRCQSVRGIRENFHRQYYGDLNCPLCHSNVDSQEHALKCSVLMKHIDID